MGLFILLYIKSRSISYQRPIFVSPLFKITVFTYFLNYLLNYLDTFAKFLEVKTERVELYVLKLSPWVWGSQF